MLGASVRRGPACKRSSALLGRVGCREERGLGLVSKLFAGSTGKHAEDREEWGSSSVPRVAALAGPWRDAAGSPPGSRRAHGLLSGTQASSRAPEGRARAMGTVECGARKGAEGQAQLPHHVPHQPVPRVHHARPTPGVVSRHHAQRQPLVLNSRK